MRCEQGNAASSKALSGWAQATNRVFALDVFAGRTEIRYVYRVIKNSGNRATDDLYRGCPGRSIPPEVAKRAIAKLFLIDTVTWLEDLRVPPGNRLEALRGDRFGQHAIRVNDQWRICLVWREGDACDVEFCDYH